jgi:predicted alpha/beta-hydrolase family hydrolase
MGGDTVTVTEYEFHQPARAKPDRAVLLAHGAGADMHSANLVAFADALAAAKIPVLRFNFPYRSAGRRSPDRAPVLEAALVQAHEELQRRTKLGPERIVLGGRSMGGRYASMLAASSPALGLLLLGYPLHAPGRPDQMRSEHFSKLRMPVLFVEGTRDTFGTPDELRAAARTIKGKVSWHWIETGDHSFKPLKRETGKSLDDVLGEAANAAVAWVRSL